VVAVAGDAAELRADLANAKRPPKKYPDRSSTDPAAERHTAGTAMAQLGRVAG